MRATFHLTEQINTVGSSRAYCFGNHRGLKCIRGIIVIFVLE